MKTTEISSNIDSQNKETGREHLLIRAARGEKVERTPVWAMRQAGRWDPEFMRLRTGHDFFSFSANASLSAQASLCPKRFGVDGIILFYDITTLPMSMGLPFTLQPERGPVPDKPIRSLQDLDRLKSPADPASYQHIIDLITIVRQELAGELPILVFAGAPFTVATYCIDTGKHLNKTRAFIRENPIVWGKLLDQLSEATIDFLNQLEKLGAHMYQLFDSWAGELNLGEYNSWAHSYHQQIFKHGPEIPGVLFVKECPYLEQMTQSGAKVISLGCCHSLKQAIADYPHLVFQGNVDETIMQTGSVEDVVKATQSCLREGNRFHHILNLNHGMDRNSPVENFSSFVQTALHYPWENN